ncbi:MAG: hypothetical protein KGI27_09935 [Thaumarchaeota archaeon]|nr:hypothetical protein [Nitrososphaerota archaeon]
MSIVQQVQTLLFDTNVFWPNQWLFDAINEAQFHVYAETRWAITSASFTLNSNADVFPLPGGIQIPRWIEGTNNLIQPPVVKRFFPTTQRNLEAFLRTWRGQNQGQPVYFVIWDATHLRCFPRPDALGSGPGGSYPFAMFGIGTPNEIVDTTTDIIGPATYVQAIQNYAAALLFEATRPDLADMYRSLAEQQILEFKKRLRHFQSHDIWQLVPATTRFEVDQGGEVYSTPDYYPLEGAINQPGP